MKFNFMNRKEMYSENGSLILMCPSFKLVFLSQLHVMVLRQSSPQVMWLSGWLWLLACLPGLVLGLAGGGACRLLAKPVSGSVYRAGDVVIGGLFPIHVEAPEPELEFRSKRSNTNCTM